MTDRFGHEFKIGADVEMPEPNEMDTHNQSFIGVVVDCRNGNAVVSDCEGDCFDIEPDRLSVIALESHNTYKYLDHQKN